MEMVGSWWVTNFLQSPQEFFTYIHNLHMCDSAKLLQIFTNDYTIGSMIGMATLNDL